MSNYKYAIKKLPIKSWIKYWLWRNRTGGTKYKFALSDIKEGSNFYLENTIKRKFNIFEIYGTPTTENLTGSINEKVQNKNIASLETSKEKVVDGLPFTVEDGIIKINGTNTSTNSFFFDSFKTNSSTAMFWLEITGYTDKDSSNASILLQQSDDNINFSTLVEIQFKSTIGKTRQVTLDSNKYYRIRLYVNKNTFTNSEIKVQLEYGNQKTAFIPHAEQNISFPLAEGQVLAQGDYLADDGIHHVREEVIEPYTEAQQTAYNQIKELYTYNEVTNIDGDANLKIKYWERVER